MPKIAIIPGSVRVPGNAKGIGAWLSRILEDHLNHSDATEENRFSIVPVDFTSPPHPLGPIVDGARMPAQIRDPALYSSPSVREWSAFVSSCDGFVVLTPQFNWGVPGDLKNAFDHLYWEWRGKPVMLVTYGGHGGSRCAAQLKDILSGGLGMQVVTPSVQITLPSDYIREDHRVPQDGPFPEFLDSYKSSTQEAADELKQLIKKSSE